MAKQTYYEQLRDARWQKKRLEVMAREGFACEHCNLTEGITLNVHHSYYEKGLAPWDYPSLSLHCLCEDCHKKAQNYLTLLHRQLGKIDVADELQALYGFAIGLEVGRDPGIVIDVSSYGVAWGIAAALGLTPGEVINAMQDTSIDGHKLMELRAAKKQARNG